mgnify:FL=1
MSVIGTVIYGSSAAENDGNMFADDEDFECLGMCSDAVCCMKFAETLRPDLLFLNVQPGEEQTCIEIIGRLKNSAPGMIIIMLTENCDTDFIFNAVMQGVDGYVIKDSGPKEYIPRIKNLYNEIRQHENDSINVISVIKEKVNDMYDSRAELMYIISKLIKLSPAEIEILRDIYNGMKYREIAEKRFVEEGTVKSSTSRILKKCNEKRMKELIEKLKKLSVFDYL